MEAWLCARGYRLVPPEFVCIPGFEYVPPPPASEEAKTAETSAVFCPIVDKGVPYVIQTRCNNTVSVRVVQKQNEQQLFVIVRNATPIKFVKKDLFAICDDFAQFADCVFFSTRIPPETAVMCLQKAAGYKHVLELLHLNEIHYDKLRNPKVANLRVLDEASIQDVEDRYMRKRVHFPKMHASDPIARYLNLRVGMVLDDPKAKTWRIVIP